MRLRDIIYSMSVHVNARKDVKPKEPITSMHHFPKKQLNTATMICRLHLTHLPTKTFNTEERVVEMSQQLTIILQFFHDVCVTRGKE